jgi:hypothetical protein
MVDLGTLTYSYNSGVMVASLPNVKRVTGGTLPNALCDIYTAKSGSDVSNKVSDKIFCTNNGYFFNENESGIAIYDSAYTDATAFNVAMNGVQLVYELATTYTVQLTPTQVRSLLGTNNVWSDSGEMASVVYVRDINTVIGDILTRLETLEPPDLPRV